MVWRPGSVPINPLAELGDGPSGGEEKLGKGKYGSGKEGRGSAGRGRAGNGHPTFANGSPPLHFVLLIND